MNVKTRIAALVGALALLLTPAAALANGPEYKPAHPTHPAHPTPGPKAPLPEKAKAYGVKCRAFPKTHEKGQKGTPFSQCVTAMAKAANGQTAKAACKVFSKEHVAGQKGTKFSRCVVAAAKVKKEVASEQSAG
ncbi:MAG TPA: hypothetical protein VGI17_16325 [Solirubrobacterales bacterium]|jgi:hypothetical protein